MENGNLLQPYVYIKRGYSTRNDKLCCDILIILKPFQTLEYPIDLNANKNGIYKYSQLNKYEEIIKSDHNRNNVLNSGCGDYVKELESLGYKILEESIVAKISIKP
ncbi:hypothetical protein [Chryseobacterium cheonjiense]|uniref:Uncharacterized protein n=1 Tax=Chryseobacterium cheonjiense TaxID=2728845 RepID=A0A7Y0FJC4_9FLAO|nr:hypothetical protein [Chryseobacterium cheonjiense]NML58404.1 hypothetical protein [Chryseobacterium cheonjiense]